MTPLVILAAVWITLTVFALLPKPGRQRSDSLVLVYEPSRRAPVVVTVGGGGVVTERGVSLDLAGSDWTEADVLDYLDEIERLG